MTVLHRCAARGQEVVGGPLVHCERPGTAHFSPAGLGYWLCSYHAERFKDDVTPACNVIPPETGSDLHQYDGSPRYPDGTSVRDLVAEAEAGDQSDYG